MKSEIALRACDTCNKSVPLFSALLLTFWTNVDKVLVGILRHENLQFHFRWNINSHGENRKTNLNDPFSANLKKNFIYDFFGTTLHI